MSDPAVRDIFLSQVERHCQAVGISEREFGYRAVQDYRFVERVRADKTTLRVLRRAELYLQGHVNAPAAPQTVAA